MCGYRHFNFIIKICFNNIESLKFADSEARRASVRVKFQNFKQFQRRKSTLKLDNVFCSLYKS